MKTRKPVRIVQNVNEPRINYLVRVLDHFMNFTPAGSEIVHYDDADCDGHCLASDFAAELNIDTGGDNEH